MRLVGQVDPVALERGLIDRVVQAQERSAVARVTILVPTHRLRDHLLGRLAERREAWVGVEVLTLRAFVVRAAERAGLGLRLIDPRVSEELTARLLRESSGSWSELSARRPGVIGRVAGALTDLRDAGVEPSILDRVADEARFGELAGLYRRWCEALETLAGRGLTDEAGLVARLLGQPDRLTDEGTQILVHGAYEWTGQFLDLLRAVDREREITLFIPVLPGSTVTVFAERFAHEFLIPTDSATKIELADVAQGSALGARLGALYGESDNIGPLPEGTIRFRHAQGAATEARMAVREALAAIAEGTAPHEIVIAARSLGTRSPALEQALDQAGVGWSGSLTAPLRRDPTVRALLLALEVVERDYPRRLTAELLGSTVLDWSRLNRDRAAPDGELADRLSRERGIVGGIDEWQEWLVEPKHGRTPAVDRILETLEALGREFDPVRERTWAEHGAIVSRWFGELVLVSADSPGLDPLIRLLSVLADLDLLPGAHPVNLVTFRAWLDRAVDATPVALERGDGGGIRVLDAMQLRGMTFRRAILLGFNAREIPATIREDPVLPDALRRRLRQEHLCPIPIKDDAPHEERLLLALLLGAAQERIDISWQRADERGRSVALSLALREVARLIHGEPDLARVVAEATHIPAHPLYRIEQSVADTGILTADEERLLTVLRSAGASAPLASTFPELGPSLAMLRVIESFDLPPAQWDGRVGAGLEPGRKLSVSAVATLAHCPLQYLFAHEWRVAELPDEPDTFQIEARELGILIHEVLAAIYARITTRGIPAVLEKDLDVALSTWISEAWNDHLREPIGRRARRAPAFWAHFTDRWQSALKQFVREDLARLAERQARSMRLEHGVERPIDLGLDAPLLLSARLDRWVETPRGPIVSDYKTGALTEPSPLDYLRGAALQAPLYWLLAGESAEVELLGVRPRPAGETEPAVVRFAGFVDPGLTAGFRDTLRVLVGQARSGAYALRAGRHCAFCRFNSCCRHNHPPTLAREAKAEDSRELRGISIKTKKHPLVAEPAPRKSSRADAEEDA